MNKYKLSVLSSPRNYLETKPIAKGVTSLREKPSLYYVENCPINVFMDRKLIYTGNVATFNRKVFSHFESISNVLVNAIRSLKLSQEYNGTYIAYLSGQLSEEEFLEEAQHYSYSPDSELSKETLNDIRILFSSTKIEFSPSDIADIFKIDYDKSVEAVEMCAKVYLNE